MKWVWIVEEEPGKNYFVTHMVSADGKVEWFLHPDEGKTGWQQATYLPYFWLPKEPYVYLVGRGCCARSSSTHYMERSLIRFNLETGQLSMVLPWNMGKGSYSIGFSPGATYLRWTAQEEHSVHIMGLSSGKETLVTFSDQYNDIGGEYDKPQEGWSPDGKKFIQEMYIGCQPASNVYCFRVAFAVIEAETGHFQVINNKMTQSIDAENRWDYKIAWADDEHVRLSVSGNQSIVDVDISENQ